MSARARPGERAGAAARRVRRWACGTTRRDDDAIRDAARDALRGRSHERRRPASTRRSTCAASSRRSPNWHYLDSAATAQKPQAVIDAITQAYARDYATVHRGVYQRSAEMTAALRGARAAAAAKLIGGQAERAGVHPRRDRGDQPRRARAAEGRPQPRAAVDARASQQHRPVAARRLRSRRRAADRRRADRPRRGREACSPSEHRVVAFAHVSNALGSILDAKRAAEIAHSKGALLLLDGCQAVPRMPVDVAAIGCDFYAFSGAQALRPDRDRLPVGPRRAARGDAAVAGRRGDDRAGHVRATPPTPTPPAAVRGGHSAHRRRDRAARGGRTGSRICRSTRSTRTNARWSPNAARRCRRSPGSRSTAPRTAPGSSASTSTGCIAHDIATILDDAGVAVRAGHHCAQPLMAGSASTRPRGRASRRTATARTSRRWCAGSSR